MIDPTKKLRILLTGASGMVGEGVLLECLQSAAVAAVTVLGRRACGHQHPKLREILTTDFYDLAPLAEQLTGFDACFFCLGASAIGMTEADYTRVSHTLTLHVAATLAARNPGLTFCYVSGAGTDSSEKGRQMWARVKGRTENDLRKLSLGQAVAFRPALIQPRPGQLHVLTLYKRLGWLYPLIRALAPGAAGTVTEIARAMMAVARHPAPKLVLEVKDIRTLATQAV